MHSQIVSPQPPPIHPGARRAWRPGSGGGPAPRPGSSLTGPRPWSCTHRKDHLCGRCHDTVQCRQRHVRPHRGGGIHAPGTDHLVNTPRSVQAPQDAPDRGAVPETQMPGLPRNDGTCLGTKRIPTPFALPMHRPETICGVPEARTITRNCQCTLPLTVFPWSATPCMTLQVRHISLECRTRHAAAYALFIVPEPSKTKLPGNSR